MASWEELWTQASESLVMNSSSMTTAFNSSRLGFFICEMSAVTPGGCEEQRRSWGRSSSVNCRLPAPVKTCPQLPLFTGHEQRRAGKSSRTPGPRWGLSPNSALWPSRRPWESRTTSEPQFPIRKGDPFACFSQERSCS